MDEFAEPERIVSILVLDDEEIIRETFRDYLEPCGYSVKTAENSTEAISILKQFKFDVLIVDYNLPDMNGITFIKEAMSISPNYIAILITGFNSLEVAVEGMRIGLHDYLIKPLNLKELKALVSNAVDERIKFVKGKANLQDVIRSIPSSVDQSIVHIIQNSTK